MVLISVYAPNWDDVGFINKLIFPNFNSHKLILAGDLNAVTDPVKDRSHPKLTRSKMSRALCDFLDQTGGIDPWRFLYPHQKKFSFLMSTIHSAE